MKKWHEIAIALLLVAVTFFATRYYRNEQVLNLQERIQTTDNGIIATTNLLQRGFNEKQLNIQDFINLGWQLVPQRTATQPDSLPRK